MEQPGYAQMRKLIQFQQYQFEPLFVREKLGFDVEAVTQVMPMRCISPQAINIRWHHTQYRAKRKDHQLGS